MFDGKRRNLHPSVACATFEDFRGVEKGFLSDGWPRGRRIPGSGSDVVDLQDLVAVVVDYFDRDVAGGRLGERLRQILHAAADVVHPFPRGLPVLPVLVAGAISDAFGRHDRLCELEPTEVLPSGLLEEPVAIAPAYDLVERFE